MLQRRQVGLHALRRRRRRDLEGKPRRPGRGVGRAGCGPLVHFSLVHERRPDGRWSAQVAEFPQLVGHGATKDEATAKAEALALSALAEKRFLNSDPGS